MTLPVKLSGRSQRLVPAAKPEPVRLKWEKFSDVILECKQLIIAHWKEVDIFHEDAPLLPDWKRYKQFEEAGMLFMMTARAGDRLVGYLTVLAYPHLHHKSTKWCTVDVMWLHPNYRVGWTGVRMIRHLERNMRKIGGKVIWFAVKEHFVNRNKRNVGKVLQFLGYDAVETVYAKVLK